MPRVPADSTMLAPELGLRRDGETGASSASDLLITVFGELMRPSGGRAWTQTLSGALALAGIEDKAARQAISRLARKGWLESEPVGRKRRWQLTPWATDVLTRGADRIYGLGVSAPSWTGEWLVLVATVPEAHRRLRARLAERLRWVGFGTLGNGVWLSPRPEREAEAARLLADLDVPGAALFRSTLTDVGDPVELASRAWPAAALAEQYGRFLGDLVPLTDVADMASDAAARKLISLVDAWRRFPFADPDLPPELRPVDWPGAQAAEAFAARRRTWAPMALRWWSDLDHSFD